MNEDAMLNRITIDQYIARLENPEMRAVLLLVYGIECPPDWNAEERWPPTYAAVGKYLGNKFRGKPLSEATVRYREKRALQAINPNLRFAEKSDGDDGENAEESPDTAPVR